MSNHLVQLTFVSITSPSDPLRTISNNTSILRAKTNDWAEIHVVVCNLVSVLKTWPKSPRPKLRLRPQDQHQDRDFNCPRMRMTQISHPLYTITQYKITLYKRHLCLLQKQGDQTCWACHFSIIVRFNEKLYIVLKRKYINSKLVLNTGYARWQENKQPMNLPLTSSHRI